MDRASDQAERPAHSSCGRTIREHGEGGGVPRRLPPGHLALDQRAGARPRRASPGPNPPRRRAHRIRARLTQSQPCCLRRTAAGRQGHRAPFRPNCGRSRIGSTGPLGASFVAAIIDRLSRRYPRMVFHIVSEDANSLIRDLDERKLDLLILRKIGPFAEDRQGFEVLYDNPYFVAAGAKNPWARRRRVKLAELIAEPWVLPPLGNRLGSLTRDIFDAQGLPYPRASVVATALEMTINLLRTDRYPRFSPNSCSLSPPSIRSSGNCRSDCRSSAGPSESSP